MSADRQRLTSAIRRIAKTDPEIRGLLDAADNKGGKPGAAGVGGGVGDGEGSNTINETRICCDGSVGEPNPGIDERNPDDGGQDGLNPDDPADTDQGPGTLDGVTDCATGEPVIFNGGGFVPPDGWDAPNAPPPDENYDEGFYWSSYTGCYFSTPGPACQCSADAADTTYSGFRIESDGEGVCFSESGDYATVIQLECPSPNGSGCDEAPPLEEKWPENGAIDLAIVGGKIVGSKYDPDQDGSYSAPRDFIDLCSGGDQISLAPSADGGWKTINSTTDNGYLYNSKGEKIAHIDGDEYSDPTM